MTKKKKHLQACWMYMVKIHILSGNSRKALKMIQAKGYEGEEAIRLVTHICRNLN